MFEIILFDFDGTLIDNTSFLITAWNNAITVIFNEPHPDKYQIKQYFGMSAVDIGKQITQDDKLVEQLVAEFRNQKVLLNETYDFYDGIYPFLKKLGANFTLGLVTSRSSENGKLTAALEELDIAQFFKVVIGYHETDKHKPNPDPILAALSQLNISPSMKVLYVGDSPYDMRSAHNAGVSSLAAGYGPTGEKLKSENPSFYVSSVFELERFLLEKVNL